MAQFNKIIETLLRDIVSAQHEANLYSISLQDTYNKYGKAKNFRLPNVELNDMEMELKYGIKEETLSCHKFTLELTKLRFFLKDLCLKLSQSVINVASETVVQSNITNNTKTKIFFLKLKNSVKVYKDFSSFLSHNIFNKLRTNIEELIDQEGNIEKLLIKQKIKDIIIDLFILDDDLEELFSGKDGENLKTEVIKAIEEEISNQIDIKVCNANFKNKKEYPQLDIAITAEELSKLPPESIHSFKIKFSPKSNITSLLEDEDENEDYIMK